MGCSSSTQTEGQGSNRPRAKPTAGNGAQMRDESETVPDQAELEPTPDGEAVDQSEPVPEPGKTAPPVSEEKEVPSHPPAESGSQAQNHEEGKRREEEESDMETGGMETEDVDTGYGADDAGDAQIDTPSFDE
ncbi:hypothetical protein NDU88_002554 [Pleurodeles waltl]|uniref:Uncharacterized protein n=1 Tax=Pleurodeles waltl TaxID=8319 RepID=A0AAV7UVZ0_PLEWA|nr:hypothetical protein NDU88_002554 [Pleurodeles waltl]